MPTRTTRLPTESDVRYPSRGEAVLPRLPTGLVREFGSELLASQLQHEPETSAMMRNYHTYKLLRMRHRASHIGSGLGLTPDSELIPEL